MFGKILGTCFALVGLYEHQAGATSVDMFPKSILNFNVLSPHMTTVTQKNIEEVSELDMEQLYQIVGEQNYVQQLNGLKIVIAKMQHAMETIIADIECETYGVIAQFYDSVMGANVADSKTFLMDISDKLVIIEKHFSDVPSRIQNIMKGSGELKYALCVAVAWATKLELDQSKLELLNRVYQSILDQLPSKDDAIALVRENATSWKVFPGEFLTLIEESK